MMAEVTPPRVAASPKRLTSEASVDNPTEMERKVFGDRKFYSMTLNMPNLNSGGGSWVIRFAELHENQDKSELVAPLATQKVDPAYPLELMRRGIQGTVTLYAIIRSDGSVGNVRVLRPDVLRLGGITPLLKVAALAEAFPAVVSPVRFPEIAVHLACGLPNVDAVEFSNWLEPLFVQPVRSREARLRAIC